MTRQELAAELLRGSAGYDAQEDYDAEGVGADDAIGRAGLSTLLLQATVADGAALNLDIFSGSNLSGTRPSAISNPSTDAGYQKIIRYLASNPAAISGVLIQSSESGSSGAPLLSSMKVKPTRDTPFGLTCTNEILVQSYQSVQDFQVNRAQLPLSEVLDTFSYLNVTTGTNGSGAIVTFSFTFFFGMRAENRRQVARGPAVLVRPNGRGPELVGTRGSALGIKRR